MKPSDFIDKEIDILYFSVIEIGEGNTTGRYQLIIEGKEDTDLFWFLETGSSTVFMLFIGS